MIHPMPSMRLVARTRSTAPCSTPAEAPLAARRRLGPVPRLGERDVICFFTASPALRLARAAARGGGEGERVLLNRAIISSDAPLPRRSFTVAGRCCILYLVIHVLRDRIRCSYTPAQRSRHRAHEGGSAQFASHARPGRSIHHAGRCRARLRGCVARRGLCVWRRRHVSCGAPSVTAPCPCMHATCRRRFVTALAHEQLRSLWAAPHYAACPSLRPPQPAQGIRCV